VANYNSTTKTSLSNFFESAVDEETSYALNARYPVHLIGENGELKAGVSARLRNKDVYNFGGTAKVTSPLSAVSQSVAPGSNYFDGAYPAAPYADIYAVRALVRANTTLSPSLGRDFNDSENVYAAYGMYTFNIGKLSVLGGLRVEQTDATYGNYRTSTDALGNDTVSFVKHSKSYTDLFPTIQAKYEIQPDLQVRATWSTGIARPGFTQAGGNAGVDFTASPRPVYSAGNPDLKPTTGNNFDLDIEYYMPNGGILQFGLFDKEFENYIFAHTITNVANPVFGAGTKGDFVTYSNESAWARGMEVAYHQKFTFLPGLARGFGLDANMTVVDSRFLEYDTTISATGKNQYGSLPGTSHLTYNVALFYELNGLNLRLSSEHVGASLFGAGGSDKSGDTIQASKTNYDFTSSYEFDKHWTAYFSAKNLTDAPLRFFEGVHNRPIQREIYGQTYEAGIRAKF
jgi:TonB-dependent receptor